MSAFDPMRTLSPVLNTKILEIGQLGPQRIDPALWEPALALDIGRSQSRSRSVSDRIVRTESEEQAEFG